MHLAVNQLSGIPAELGQLANLQRLALWDNQLTGAIPSQLGDLANLLELDLYSNRLTGSIPPELGKLTAWPRLTCTTTGSLVAASRRRSAVSPI